MLCKYITAINAYRNINSGTTAGSTTIQYDEATIDYTVIPTGILWEYYSDFSLGQKEHPHEMPSYICKRNYLMLFSEMREMTIKHDRKQRAKTQQI